MAYNMAHFKNVQGGTPRRDIFFKERSTIFFTKFNKLYVYQPNTTVHPFNRCASKDDGQYFS